jgi:hypothetical protein
MLVDRARSRRILMVVLAVIFSLIATFVWFQSNLPNKVEL